MKKTSPRNARFAPLRLDAVTGGGRAQIIEIGGTNPPAEQESDISSHIIEIG